MSMLTYVDGRVMLRSDGVARVEFPKSGRALMPGDTLITGDQSRLALRVGDAGLWWVGRRAVFTPMAEGGRLTAGTALVRVPTEAGLRVESSRGVARLGKGLWMLQAVDNEGLKIICLDGPAPIEALGESTPVAGAAETVSDRLNLHPGELVFLRPEGKAFGPIVTIYLEELLATSRLVNGFPEPLAELQRLRNLGLIQREQLKGVTNALVAGAHDDKGFEIAVPRPKPVKQK
ncbi:MAG: hypothetical protein WC205_01260 [Opitutaceae bacterium]